MSYDQVDDRGDKHSARFASHGRNEFQGNYVIQHQSLLGREINNAGGSLP